ncbi:MAG: phenylacetate-CoA oxygenase subunit PaaC [Alcaligenaceae bacterium]|nr:phenylacetate-CoA oxygenase subunit PaaC [Alcaligenaceae bacterium]
MKTVHSDTSTALQQMLLRMGDNTLVLGHRISEWCGHAPVLEEDIAMANIALDFIGQTQFWLELAAELEAEGKTADQLAYLRDCAQFRNLLLAEQPNGDYAHTVVRQFLFDAWHFLQLQALTQSTDARVAEIAAKAIKEVNYHLERSSDLLVRLGDGTPESHTRMQSAVDDLWAYTGEMFVGDEHDIALAKAGLAPLPESLRNDWLACVQEVMQQATLTLPDNSFMHKGGKQGRHTEYLGHLLAQMQFLQRAYPGCTW